MAQNQSSICGFVFRAPVWDLESVESWCPSTNVSTGNTAGSVPMMVLRHEAVKAMLCQIVLTHGAALPIPTPTPMQPCPLPRTSPGPSTVQTCAYGHWEGAHPRHHHRKKVDVFGHFLNSPAVFRIEPARTVPLSRTEEGQIPDNA